MTPLFGKVAIYAALLMAVGAAAIAFYSARDKSKRELATNAYWLTVIVFVAITVASLVLLAAFIAKNYTLEYVGANSSPDMSLFYRIAAFWAGQEGSLLLWVWMLAGMGAIIAWRRVAKSEELVTYALGVLNVITVFFLIVLVTPAGDPFKLAPAGQAIGRGINPLLLHWAMVIHPPTLFVGYAGLAIPFAFAIATLLAGDASRRWLNLCGRWSVVAWLFLSIGIFLGALWAYVVLGWGGFWGWDPVENSSLLPWLTATAMLHSFTVWRRRDTFKFWSVSLAGVTFFLTLLATYITRSGIIQSAHTFPGDTVFKFLFEVFMAVVLFGTAGLLWWRRGELHSPTFGEAGEAAAEGLFSREFVYYLNNVIICVATAIIGYATLAPAITRVLGKEISYKAEFYNGLAAPISVAYMIILAICPLVSWKKTDPEKFARLLIWPGVVTVAAAVPIVMAFRSSVVGVVGMIASVLAASAAIQVFVRGAMQRSKSKGIDPFAAFGDLFVRNRSQTGGYLVHIGIAITIIGITGSTLYATTENVGIASTKGSKVQAGKIGLTVVDFKTKSSPKLPVAPSTYVIEEQKLTLGLTENGKYLGTIAPMLKAYQNNIDQEQGPSPQVDIRIEPLRDIFVIYQGETTEGELSLQVKVNPLISFVWFGSVILILGATWAMWPTRRETAAAA